MKSSHTASVARSPRTARHGSPGITLASVKTMKMRPSRTGIVTSSRLAMNLVKGFDQSIQIRMR